MTITFAPAEAVMEAILAGVGTPVVMSTSVDLNPPLIRVRRVPGEPRTMFDDPAHIEVLTFGSTFLQAEGIAENVANAVRFAYGKGYTLTGGAHVTVDFTDAILPPTELPWPTPNVRVFQATYRVITRGVPA